MQCKRFAVADHFLVKASEFLTRREAEHTILLGVALGGRNQPEGDAQFFVVEDQDIYLAAGLTPPFPLTLSHGAPEALGPLAEALAAAGIRPSGVGGFNGLAERFADRWQNEVDVAIQPGLRTVLYRLTEVSRPPQVPGALRPAEMADFDRLLEWHRQFEAEIGTIPRPKDNLAKAVAAKIASGRMFHWVVNGRPVSMVSYLPTGAAGDAGRINAALTPKAERGKGYASAAVAALSQQLLDRGWRYCLIFADATNPTTTRIYPRLGYRELNRYQELRFRDDREQSRRSSPAAGPAQIRR